MLKQLGCRAATWKRGSYFCSRRDFAQKAKSRGGTLTSNSCVYRVFSHDVMAAIFVPQNNETAAMFVS